MKIELHLYDDCVDRIVLKALRSTIQIVNDPKAAELFPDAAEVTKACNTLIAYYGIPESEQHLEQRTSTDGSSGSAQRE